MKPNIEFGLTNWESGTNSVEAAKAINFSGTTKYLKILPAAELAIAGTVAWVGLRQAVKLFGNESTL